MTVRNLSALLAPRSIAVVGASSHAGTLGQRVLENIISGGFEGAIFAINPKRGELDDAWWLPSVEELPVAPDVAIIVTPAATVPDIVRQLGAKGTRIAVIVSAGFHDPAMRQAILDAARPTLLRIVGPNCLGVMMPRQRLNASFAEAAALPGGIALISQSGALVTSMVDWACARHVGFSGIVSVGDMADVDLGDLIDLFAADPATHAILMYVEGVTNPAKFMSAARAAARVKPVIAIKAGRTQEAGKAALSHTGALAGAWDVHEAAFRRAGIVMVDTLTELFDAAQMLSARHRFAGDRLAIVTNGGGPGILATDALARVGGTLATLSDATIAALDPQLPSAWSRSNPVDVIGDAHADRFAIALDAVARDDSVDAVLVLHCPTAMEAGAAIARAVVARVRRLDFPQHKPVIACWLGPHDSANARAIFRDTGIALFDNLDDAVRAFGHLRAARIARESLMRAPPRRLVGQKNRDRAKVIIARAQKDGRTRLTPAEAADLLDCYGVPVVVTRTAEDIEAIERACRPIDPPYALKVISPQILHKSDVGGVVLDLPDVRAVVASAREMSERIARERPDATITGFAIEPMVSAGSAYELIAGIADDPTFGPVIAVGAGGTGVERIADRSLGLPPLDDTLARDMIGRTRISKLLAGYRDRPAADIDGIVGVLNALSTMAVDLPDILECDINPLRVDASGVLAIDVRVLLAPHPVASRLAILPVPTEWSANLRTRDGLKMHVRPVVPEDEPLLADLFAHVDPEDLRFRFLSAIREVGHERLAAMAQIDYRRTMTFIAFEGELPIATAMLASDPDGQRAELALSVRRDRRRRGVSWTLLEHVLRYAEARGIGLVESVESSDNHAALTLEREMGFKTVPIEGSPGEILVSRRLTPPEPAEPEIEPNPAE